MAAQRKGSKSDQASIKYRWVPLNMTSPTLSDIGQKEDVSKPREPYKQSCTQSGSKSPDILSTSQLVSAVGRLWDCTVRPLPASETKANIDHNESFYQKENALRFSGGERNNKESKADTGNFCIGLKSATVYSNSDCNSSMETNSAFKSGNRLDDHSIFWRYLQLGDPNMHVESWNVNRFLAGRILYDFGKIYERVIRKPSLGLMYPVHLSQTERMKPGEACILGSKTILEESLPAGSAYCSNNVAHCNDPPSHKSLEVAENKDTDKSVNSLYSDCFLNSITNSNSLGGAVSKDSTSDLCSEYHIDHLDVYSCACKESPHISEEDTNLDINKRQPKEVFLENASATEFCAVVNDKPKHALPGQRHAFAGALSGTCVSLCLHPVDTIKTVIQSRSMDEKSIRHIIRSIISERGVFGLYGGIASNIASSAPISAVYTYTYESVKGALLPLLPKEYHSIAHCTAGGCASIATSFIFTPSERIKQQMQVGSHYQNCWNALVGIIERGGLPSLYAGWGAVLCRNIPHSIIKFYTYETLKRHFLSSKQPNAHPSTFLTLLCGGVAGSTAALFTTPFDVVKTRLQTQIPGSLCRYNGVSHALLEISKHEGLKGLYRGLTPRLIMYVSQGALFFASYEFFKTLFFLELPQLCAPAVQDKQNGKDGSTSLRASPSTASMAKMQSFHS